jgi:hypothetical protein
MDVSGDYDTSASIVDDGLPEKAACVAGELAISC